MKISPQTFSETPSKIDAKKRNGKAGRQKVTAENYNIIDNPSAGRFDVPLFKTVKGFILSEWSMLFYTED